MDSATSVVLAIDGGGTHTRVTCHDLTGRVRGRASGPGSNPLHHRDPAANLISTIRSALADAGRPPSAVSSVAAGIAGIEIEPSVDDAWADQALDGIGLECPRSIVNDAVIAHRGALAGGDGIIVVAGTGSMILARGTGGLLVESGSFDHYAGGARHLVYELVQDLLTMAPTEAAADPILAHVFEHWKVDDLDALRSRIIALRSGDRAVARRSYGDFAPSVSAAADSSPAAGRALDRLVDRTARGVRLLLPLVGGDPVQVGTAGALATHPAFQRRLELALVGSVPPSEVVPAALGPAQGAAIMALELAGVRVDGSVLDQLGRW